MKAERRHFDEEAATYPQIIGDSYTQSLKWQLIAAHAPPGAIAADIGAASGRHAVPLARSNATVAAVDMSEGMLGKLAQRAATGGVLQNLFCVAAALPDLPLRPRAFDLVYCYSTLLLLPHEKQAAALESMANLLRDDGVLIADLAGSRSMALGYWSRYYRRRGFPGLHGWRIDQAKALLVANGLELIDIIPQGVASQFLLTPGVGRIPGFERFIRGTSDRPGLDDRLSRLMPSFAERWYLVGRRRGGNKSGG